MKRQMRGIRLRTKILAVSLAFLLLNSLLAGVLCYTYVTRDTLKNFYQSSNDLLMQINSHLNASVRGISQKVMAINSNSAIYESLYRAIRADDGSAYAALMSNMADVISEFQISADFVSSLYIYTPLGSFENFTHIQKEDFDFTESVLYEKFEENPTLYSAWYPAMSSPIFRDPEIVIPVVYRVQMAGTYGYFVVSLYQREIQDYLDDTYSSYDYLFIVDADGAGITSVPEDAEQIIDAFADVKFDAQDCASLELDYQGEHYLATYTVMRSNGWQIYGLRSQASLTGNLIRFRGLIVMILVICVLSSGILVTLLVRRMTDPLVELTAFMDRVTQAKDFTVRAAWSSRDEVGALTASFNALLQEIEQLIEQLNIHIEALQEEKEAVRRIQAQKRKAEIKALQAQISPHFLYNTLNTISWQAADQGENEISVLATSLGRFFRISLSRGREVIELSEEMEQVRSYLQIQKIRYKDILDYSFEIEPDARNRKMVKLLVQPLVENAIYHGVKPADRPGHIRISASLHTNEYGNELIWITVEDDGAGIEPEPLRELNELLAAGQTDPNSGYGIFNVNERIKLYYGAEYGLMLESAAGEWTRATLVFPPRIVEDADETMGV